MINNKAILVYHRINDTVTDYNRITVSPQNFDKQMEYLKKEYEVIPAEDILSYDGENNAVAVTFDDGYADFYYNAMKTIERLNFPVSVFVCTQRVGSNRELWMTELLRIIYFSASFVECLEFNAFGQRVKLPLSSVEDRSTTYNFLRSVCICMGEADREELLGAIRKQLNLSYVGRAEYRLLNLQELRELSQNDSICIGAHTVSHPSLGRICLHEKRREIRSSINFLEELTRKRVRLFSYPFGGINDYDWATQQLLDEAGIEMAYAVENSAVTPNTKKYSIPRGYVCDWGLDMFKSFMKDLFDGTSRGIIKADEELSQSQYFGNKESDTLSNTDVVIWGTGKNAQQAYTYAINKQCKVIAFVDNNTYDNCNELLGVPVWDFNSFLEYGKGLTVIVKNNHGPEIVKKLDEYGINMIHWWI